MVNIVADMILFVVREMKILVNFNEILNLYRNVVIRGIICRHNH